MTVRGNSVTIWERRPPPVDTSDEWTRVQAAQLRYDDIDEDWSLYWRHKGRWEPYAEHLILAKALTMVGEDKLGAFFT